VKRLPDRQAADTHSCPSIHPSSVRTPFSIVAGHKHETLLSCKPKPWDRTCKQVRKFEKNCATPGTSGPSLPSSSIVLVASPLFHSLPYTTGGRRRPSYMKKRKSLAREGKKAVMGNVIKGLSGWLGTRLFRKENALS
jgi:hypothetical protein